MDPYLSGEDLVIKTRKPYTITKQRERWTEEEHTRFLEALKLYGRAWQRIEEYIGTKTAIQIRSHAQKFFTKLEKEANVKGEGRGFDIEIPPPRPKRKPNNPYPRKTCIAPVLQLGMDTGNISDATSTLQHEEPEKLYDDEEFHNNKDCYKNDSCFEATVAPCTSPNSVDNISVVSEASIRSGAFRKYVPVINESKQMGDDKEVSVEKHLFHDGALKSSVIMDPSPLCDESLQGEMATDPNKSGNCCQSSISDEHASKNYPCNVDVHILGGNAQQFPSDMSFMLNPIHGDQNLVINPDSYATSDQSFLNCNQFVTPVQSSDDYQTFSQMHSTFSGLILSTLSQNAAVYAAASHASTLWPWFNKGALEENSTNCSMFSELQPTTSTSHMGQIAAATVAAATAWWTTNGFLPLCHSYPGFTSPPASVITSEIICSQAENRLDHLVRSDAQNTKVKSRSSSSSESEAEKFGLIPSGTAELENVDMLHDSNKSKNTKQIDRSSCGSNTTSSSDNELDANRKEEKYNKTNEDNNVPDTALPITDLSTRRCRINNNLTDSWKEVSQEGRQAFRALFSREVLPQSFAPSHDIKNKVKRNCSEHELITKLDENRWSTGTSFEKPEANGIMNIREGLRTEGIGHMKLKACRTGFKPYKRCSMEAKESTISSSNQEEDKNPKKLRLERQVTGCSIS